MTLEWRQHEHDQNCYVTTCRRYSVSVCDGQWSAWRMVPSGSHFAPIEQKLPNMEEARKVAQADADRANWATSCAQP